MNKFVWVMYSIIFSCSLFSMYEQIFFAEDVRVKKID